MVVKFELFNFNDIHSKDLKDFYCLRKKIFKDKLDWLVKCKDGMEFDEYDSKNASYLMGKRENEVICGCRFIDMKLHNMCTGVFYKYFDNIKILKGNYVEMTRILIDKEKVFDFEHIINLRLNFFLNIHTVAKESGYEGIYAVATEQLLKSLIKSGWEIKIQQRGMSEKNEYLYLIIMPTDEKAIIGLKEKLKKITV